MQIVQSFSDQSRPTTPASAATAATATTPATNENRGASNYYTDYDPYSGSYSTYYDF